MTRKLFGSVSRKTIILEAKATVSLAGPMIMTMVAIVAMETVDALMIGRLGEEALAAAALGLTAWFLFLLFGMGVLGAVSSLTAQAVAVDDLRGVRRSARQGIWIGIMMGTPFAIALHFAEPVFLALDQDPVVAGLAQDYLDWMGWAMVPVFLNIPVRLTMAAFEVTRPSMYIAIGAIPFNALFNWIFMFGGLGGPELGLAGAGLSTVLAYSIIMIGTWSYIALAPRFRELDVFARLWRPDWQRFWQILVIGTPIGAAFVMEYGLFSVAAIMMGWVGVSELAGHQIATQVLSVAYMIPFGLSQAATIRIGLAAGKRDLEAVRLRGTIQFGLTIAFMGFASLLFWFFAEPLVSLFLSAEDPNRDAVVAFGTFFLLIAALFQIFDGIQAVGTGILRGLNDTVFPMVWAFIGYWAIGITCVYWWGFGLDFGGVGIWYGMLAALFATSASVLWRFYWLCRTEHAAFKKLED